LQARTIASDLGLEFDTKEFNFSHKWLAGFKQAFGISRMRLHGEGADANLQSVEIVRKELPPLLADTPLSNIYNFDETGERYLFYLLAC
jgi:hypothetical protein